MTTQPWPRSMQELAGELTTATSLPVVFRGRELSGRSAAVQTVAESLGADVMVFEAADLQGSALPWEDGFDGRPGLRSRLDEMVAMAVSHMGENVVIVIDHLDAPLVRDPAPIIAAAEWMAAQVHVVVVSSAESSHPLPAQWPTIEHGSTPVRARPAFGEGAGL